MALIECIDCHSKVSDRADDCPHCGCPVEASLPRPADPPPAPDASPEEAAAAAPVEPEPEPTSDAGPAPDALAPEPEEPQPQPACSPGELCHFADYSELAALLRAGKTHAVVRGEKTRWTWQGVVVGGVIGTIIVFLWSAVATRLGIPNLEQIAGAITLLLSPLLLYLRWHRPRDYMIVHDDRVSFVRQVKFERGVGVGEMGDTMPLSEIERVVYRTTFWKKWLTLVRRDGERISFTHGLINRRRRMPGVEAVRMRTAADLLGYLGVPHRFNYALAVVSPIFVLIWGFVANFDYSQISAEAAAASAPPARYEVLRTTNMRDGPSPRDMIYGRLPAGTTVTGVAVSNAAGEVWIRISEGPHAGKWLWGKNIRAASDAAGLEASPDVNTASNMAAAAPPIAEAWGNAAASLDMAPNGMVTHAPPTPAPAPIGLEDRLIGRWVPAGEACAQVGIAFNNAGTYHVHDGNGQWWVSGGSLILEYTRNGFRTTEGYKIVAADDYSVTLRNVNGDLALTRCGR